MIDIDRIYNEDCIEGMKKIPDGVVDAIICDLPYGTTSCQWDVVIPFDQLWEQYHRICKPNDAIILFGSEPFSSFLRMSNLSEYKYDIYWEKERLTNINQVKRRVGKTVETISIFYKSQCTYNPQMAIYTGTPRTNKVKNGKLGILTDSSEKKVFEYKDNGLRYPTQVWKFQRDCLTNNIHPTQKPVALIQQLIKTYTNEGELILDNCMGSGTTAIAAIRENRHFIGFELDTKYYDKANERIANEISGRC